MAYFQHNEQDETRRNDTVSPEMESAQEYEQMYEMPQEYEDDAFYDDGFDETQEDVDYEDDLTEEEKQEQKKDRIRILFGAGDLTGIIAGSVIILLLLAFLFQMINFVRDDIHEFFDTVGRFFM